MATGTRPTSNVYAELARLKKVAREALAELEASGQRITDLENDATVLREKIRVVKGDNRNMQKVLDRMAQDNPELYDTLAREHNIM